jgi:hypothetical protein
MLSAARSQKQVFEGCPQGWKIRKVVLMSFTSTAYKCPPAAAYRIFVLCVIGTGARILRALEMGSPIRPPQALLWLVEEVVVRGAFRRFSFARFTLHGTP